MLEQGCTTFCYC